MKSTDVYFNQSIRQQYKGPIKQCILRPIRKRGQNIARSGPNLRLFASECEAERSLAKIV
ncbi:hypothetical protein T08_16758 [Trichinella sp. T8]|uniref:Uncharacterized protein n=1 Tax=Trichinella murrelli TaxID=144512 RepID=A0A0V0TKP6_9BILA|nr:hypothetical protein T05_5452 [Trichinella murrelli]KRZ96648.1 hypothetical protein T08_16758 [Trichinella sp. T8]